MNDSKSLKCLHLRHLYGNHLSLTQRLSEPSAPKSFHRKTKQLHFRYFQNNKVHEQLCMSPFISIHCVGKIGEWRHQASSIWRVWMTYIWHDMDDNYNGILLPPTCEINYVNMQHDYVNMQLILFQHATLICRMLKHLCCMLT